MPEVLCECIGLDYEGQNLAELVGYIIAQQTLQQTHFRVRIFERLAWRADPRTAGKELAEADFQIVIRSVDYGVHRLTVTHDTRTDTKTYLQHQPMSGLRWGTAKTLIAHDDLLGRTIRLYRDKMTADTFVIEID